MGTGQTFLSIAAISIFMYMSVNITQSYVTATEQSVNHQKELDAINYGLSLTEVIYSQAFNYTQLDAFFGGFDDINDPDARLNQVTQLGDSLSATIILSAEQPVLQGVLGRQATITVYLWEDGEPVQVSTHLATLMSLDAN